VLDDAAVGYPDDIDHRDLDVAPGGRHSGELDVASAREHLVRHHQVTLGDLVQHGGAEAGEGCTPGRSPTTSKG